MIDHLSTYATDFEATKRFYDAALTVLGYTVQAEMVMDWDKELPGRRACAYGANRPVFWLVEVREAASPRHIAFVAADREAVGRFHSAALLAGAPSTVHRDRGPNTTSTTSAPSPSIPMATTSRPCATSPSSYSSSRRTRAGSMRAARQAG